MGLNKQAIRQIIHADPPRGFLDAYVQEIGRGGRGAMPCRCTLLTSSGSGAQRCNEPVAMHTSNTSHCA